ncbi:phage protein GemA/Gp16 family protein, partial [Photorhabdus sp. RM157S]
MRTWRIMTQYLSTAVVLDEDTYRQMLLSETIRASTREMDIPQLTCVLEVMKKR